MRAEFTCRTSTLNVPSGGKGEGGGGGKGQPFLAKLVNVGTTHQPMKTQARQEVVSWVSEGPQSRPI